MSLQQRILSETIVGEDSSNPLNVIYHESSGHIAIDYSKYYERIATAVETLASLAQGQGLHTKGPYEYLNLISVFKNLVEEGTILNPPTIQKSATKEARNKIDQYKTIIDDLPKEF